MFTLHHWKRVILVALLSFVFLLGREQDASASGPADRFVGGGDYASVSWFDTSSFGLILVSRGGPPGDPQTHLSYFISRDGETVLSGFGAIPNSHLQGSTSSRLTLHTDTSEAANPGFNRLNGGGGIVDIEWERNRLVSVTTNGTTHTKFEDALSVIQLHSSMSSASTRGTVVGEILPDANGEMGSNQSIVVEVLRGP